MSEHHKHSKQNIPIRNGSSLDFNISDLHGKAKINSIKSGLTLVEDSLKSAGWANITLKFDTDIQPTDIIAPLSSIRIAKNELRGLIPTETTYIQKGQSSQLSKDFTIKFSRSSD